MGDFEPLLRYFQSEKQGGALALAIGVLALAASVAVWRSGWVFRAIVFPLGLVGVIQAGVGVALLLRTDRQVATLTRDLRDDPPAAAAKELARIERVNVTFRWLEVAEIVLLGAGVAMAVGFRSRPAFNGVGMGLVLQAAVMLVFDLVAEHRAHVYEDWLKRQVP
jgi:hypothetical protein